MDWALEAFAGYVAADELYEGPYCVLSAVDNQQDKRILYTGLDHDPNHADIPACLWRLQGALEARALALKGITTDGSALSPAPIREVFGEVPHQLGTSHVIAALVKGGLSAVASERKRLATAKPKLQRGRPSSKEKAARRLAPKSKAMQEKISDVFEGRFLMEHIYALFDRRCWTPTALSKLKKLRHWVKRFRWIGDTLKKVFSPNRDKTLTFLDDKLLPATSNAVERGHRRHRKMQKSVYRIRSKVG